MSSLWNAVYEILLGFLTTPAGATGPTVSVVKPLGSGYSTPRPPSGVVESRDIKDLHPTLQKKYLALKQDFKTETGKDLFETCTWRSQARQMQLFKEGRELIGAEWVIRDRRLIKTNCDGYKKKSRHNVYPAEAVDVCVDIDPGPYKKPIWDAEFYRPLGELCKKFRLTWGGNFGAFADYPHIELHPYDS